MVLFPRLVWILALGQEMSPNWNFLTEIMLKMANFVELIHWIPNFLEIGLLLSV